VYASRYLRPGMDRRVRRSRPPGEELDLGARLEEAAEKNLWGVEELETLGFVVPPRRSLPFMARPPEDVPGSESTGEEAAYGYYPGGMDYTVASSNGWNMGRHAGIWRQVDRGVSVSACGGPAYGGGPHITNTTFWDNRILMHYLFRGRDLGECFLRSTFHVNWSTSLLGDPLYHPNLRRTVPDTAPPGVASRDHVVVRIVPAMDGFAGTLHAAVVSTARHPEVAELRVHYSAEGDPEKRVSRSHLYSTRPEVLLRDLAPEARYTLRLVLRDPYGNETDLGGRLGPRHLDIPRIPDGDRDTERAVQRSGEWRVAVPGRDRFCESGRVLIEFRAGKRGMIPALRSEGLSFWTRPWSGGRVRGSLRMGDYEREFYFVSPLEEGEAARMELRWRRFPLTREVLLVTEDGRTFSVASDLRTPWRPFTVNSPLRVTGRHGTRVAGALAEDDAPPASEAAR